jgi:integrase
MEAYQRALAAAPVAIGASSRSKPGSVSAAIAEYFGSQAFRSLTGGTPAHRRSILERFRERYGERRLASLPPEFIMALLDTLSPYVARNWLKALRHFMRWCQSRKLVRTDPTLGLRIKTPRSDGHHTWTDSEVAQYEAAHPIGSKARLALALGLFTAQRRGDVIRMGRQHIRDGVLHVTQQKTGVPLKIPMHAELQAVLDAVPGNQLTFLTTLRGKPFDGKTFTQWFAKACDHAGLGPQCTFHGLRKAACRRLAEAGCTVHQIAAISGHKSRKEVERYTKAADQARLGQAAMARMTAAPKKGAA